MTKLKIFPFLVLWYLVNLVQIDAANDTKYQDLWDLEQHQMYLDAFYSNLTYAYNNLRAKKNFTTKLTLNKTISSEAQKWATTCPGYYQPTGLYAQNLFTAWRPTKHNRFRQLSLTTVVNEWQLYPQYNANPFRPFKKEEWAQTIQVGFGVYANETFLKVKNVTRRGIKVWLVAFYGLPKVFVDTLPSLRTIMPPTLRPTTTKVTTAKGTTKVTAKTTTKGTTKVTTLPPNLTTNATNPTTHTTTKATTQPPNPSTNLTTTITQTPSPAPSTNATTTTTQTPSPAPSTNSTTTTTQTPTPAPSTSSPSPTTINKATTTVPVTPTTPKP